MSHLGELCGFANSFANRIDRWLAGGNPGTRNTEEQLEEALDEEQRLKSWLKIDNWNEQTSYDTCTAWQAIMAQTLVRLGPATSTCGANLQANLQQLLRPSFFWAAADCLI